jgi:murein L,D-transpeptidase YafK
MTMWLSILSVWGILQFSPAFAQASFRDRQDGYPRVRQARNERGKYLDSLFAQLDIAYPPAEILITVLKEEKLLELWARHEDADTFTLVKKYSLTAFAGMLGPKRRQGDRQIPEGCYCVTGFNPVSNFHLSLKIDYPNESDLIRGDKNSPGGEIYIHGSSVTIGCIPIGDIGIEELYIVAVDVTNQGNSAIPVYIFPCRMDSIGMHKLRELAAGDTTRLHFWDNLEKGYKILTKTRRGLRFRVNSDGDYVFLDQATAALNDYPWLSSYDHTASIVNRIEPPPGYRRIPVEPGTFAEWLRNLPLKPGNPPVHLYDGRWKSYQGGHWAVVDIDIGTKDLQQCADAIIRIFAEYLYARKNNCRIEFIITNGDTIRYLLWRSGHRPFVNNEEVIWRHTASSDSSYRAFRDYLDFVFTYAGSYSLNRQLRWAGAIDAMQIGDIFIQGGFPGHAVLVVDMAENPQTRDKVFLLCQGFMPAQDIHILRNLKESSLGPWFRTNFGDTLFTPEWNFTAGDLKKFPQNNHN